MHIYSWSSLTTQNVTHVLITERLNPLNISFVFCSFLTRIITRLFLVSRIYNSVIKVFCHRPALCQPWWQSQQQLCFWQHSRLLLRPQPGLLIRIIFMPVIVPVFIWFNLPCFVLWVTEKQPGQGEEFRLNMNGCRGRGEGGWFSTKIQMRWQMVEEKPQYFWSFCFLYFFIFTNLLNQAVKWSQQLAWLWNMQLSPQVNSKLGGCGRLSTHEQ